VIQSNQNNRLGSLQTFALADASSQVGHTVWQCKHFGQPGPGTQNSSHLQHQQTTSILFSSHFSRQTFFVRGAQHSAQPAVVSAPTPRAVGILSTHTTKQIMEIDRMAKLDEG
jgi:hypothetical protein